MNVTIFKNIKTTSTGFVRGIESVLERIKSGKSREIVDTIRYELDKEKRNDLKQQLPSICFSGTFSNRSINGLKKHSGLICLDFDKFPDDDTRNAARETLIGDEHVFSVFTSPSGDGLKVLVKIPAQKEHHKAHFDALAIHFESPYFDKATSDVSRVCYESYDPDLYYNPESLLWVDREEEELIDLGTTDPLIPLNSDNRIIKNLLVWWNRKYGKTKGSRNSNFFILAAAFNDFGIKESEALSELETQEEVGFTKKEIGQVVKSAYKRGAAKHGTKFFEDYQLRRNIEKEVINGKSLKQVEKQFPEVKNIEQVSQKLRETMAIDEFWDIDDKGNYHLIHHKFKLYLEQNKIFKFFPTKEANSIFVKIEENKVEIISPDKIKDIVLEDLFSREGIGMRPFELMAESTKYFKENYLSILSTIDVALKADTENECFLYYNDNVIRVTQNSIDTINYLDIDGYVWKNQIIDRNFKQIEDDACDFKKFIWLVSGEETIRYNSIRSVIGYMLHSYKTPANNKCIILNDEVISDNPNGGSGKGVFCQGIGAIKKVTTIDGKQFDFNKSFAYQTVSADTQNLVFDDVKKNFAFENLFSLITEGITIEKKNQDAVKIPVMKSPKILITTNYTIGGVGGSFERRKFEVEFSSFFGSHNTPLDVFGHMLFDDWSKDEWNSFDNFMINCLQFYLKEGLIAGVYKNLATRKFIKDTSSEFYDWVNDENSPLPANIKINRSEKFKELTEEYPDLKKWLSQKKFVQWIASYAEFHKLEYISGKTNGERWSLIKDPSKPSVEIIQDDPPF